MPKDKIHLLAPIAKVETTPDGGREIWGFATLERKDKADEIADFEGTVKAFQTWSDEISKRTGGKSMGNVRVMHQPIPAGKMTHWEPGETTIQDEDGNEKVVKGIWTATYVPPHKTDVIKDVDEGILNALSIGGNYEKRWWDETEKGFRYIPELAEYSLVDNPAVPGADFANVIAKAHGPWEHDRRNLAKRDDKEDEKLHTEAEERAKKYGISFKKDGHLTPPEGYPTELSEYGDPTNYRYPIDEKHIRAAVGYFNHPDMREKGDYSESEWEVIGKRIAAAANKLIGEGHEFKDGKIDTSEERKEADKAAWGDLQKRAGTSGELSHSDIRNLLQSAVTLGNPFGGDLWVCDVYDDYCIVEDWMENKNWKVPYTIKDGKAELGQAEQVVQTWQPAPKEATKVNPTHLQKTVPPTDKEVDARIKELEAALDAVRAAQNKDQKAEGDDPNDQAVSEKLEAAQKILDELKAAQEKDNKAASEMWNEDHKKAAEALEVLKAITGRLEKRGAAVSAARRSHLSKAIDHIHMALGDEDKVEDKAHMGLEPDDHAEKVASIILEKLGGLDNLQKSAPVDVGGALAQALENAGLAKAEEVSTVTEQLTKAVEQIATLEGLVKEIGEQPQPGGPFMGAYPGLGGQMPWNGEVEKAALQNVLNTTEDAAVKDAVGRHLATDMLAQQFAAASGRKPTP
ncbi:DUF6582 domain-containing protein [Alicyclobacillus sp. SO9]|uniref:DUF6582 domain-containing protein n=1 Tax=Alicyclobacillus sp. SO9 TaxID=2665646 RepID=UPI0018E6FD30|nr:DUF6582 domain-containing protein [Alicyclobacillus sp. SO9]QQE80925.1 hypothetical protein GI364_11370 [Alicyclobacillus sp. SO9]